MSLEWIFIKNRVLFLLQNVCSFAKFSKTLPTYFRLVAHWRGAVGSLKQIRCVSVIYFPAHFKTALAWKRAKQKAEETVSYLNDRTRPVSSTANPLFTEGCRKEQAKCEKAWSWWCVCLCQVLNSL